MSDAHDPHAHELSRDGHDASPPRDEPEPDAGAEQTAPTAHLDGLAPSDELRDDLARIAELPLGERAAALAEVHERLRRALDEGA